MWAGESRAGSGDGSRAIGAGEDWSAAAMIGLTSCSDVSASVSMSTLSSRSFSALTARGSSSSCAFLNRSRVDRRCGQSAGSAVPTQSGCPQWPHTASDVRPRLRDVGDVDGPTVDDDGAGSAGSGSTNGTGTGGSAAGSGSLKAAPSACPGDEPSGSNAGR